MTVASFPGPGWTVSLGGAPGLWAVSDMSLPCVCGSSLGLGEAATPSPLHSQQQLLLLWSVSAPLAIKFLSLVVEGLPSSVLFAELNEMTDRF